MARQVAEKLKGTEPLYSPYSPDVKKILERLPKQLLIDGAFVDAADGGTIDTEDPGTAEAVATVALAGPQDVDRAVRAARNAFDDGRWTDLPAAARQEVLL